MGSGLIVVVVMATGLLHMAREEKTIIAEDHRRGLAIAYFLIDKCLSHLIIQDQRKLYQTLHTEVLKEQISYAIIIDAHGQIISHNDLQELDKLKGGHNYAYALHYEQPASREEFVMSGGFKVHDLIVPINIAGDRFGTMLIGVSHKEIEHHIAAARKQLLEICIIFLGIGLVAFNLLVFLLVTPLKKLIRATEQVAQGDFNVLVELNRKDEFGQLASSFNLMTKQLNSTTVSKNYLDNIFNSAGNAIRVIGLDYSIQKVNHAFEELVGLPEAEILGRPCSKILGGNYCAPGLCPLASIQQGENQVSGETELKLANGKNLYVSISATPLCENGKLTGIIESIQDITQKKKLEVQREQMQLQFLQAQKMESVGRLAGGVAHDFNNLLTVILGFSDIIMGDASRDSKLYENVKIIKDASNKAAILTRQLLALSRKQILDVQVVNINELVQNMLNMLGRIIGEDITLEFKLQNQLPNIKADSGQLEQVLMNLTVNARDAMPQGGRLTVETDMVGISAAQSAASLQECSPGSYVQLKITDTGTGMSDEVVNNIFEPFFTTKDQHKGTGLGLSTVYAIVKQHQGHITVNSKPGSGTSFHLLFPATEEETTAGLVEEMAELRHGSESVLIVEDESSILRMLEEMLKTLGYKVFTATNGEDAFKICFSDNNGIDLIISDITMPGISGWELARKLKEAGNCSKIIFMSGYIQNEIDKDYAEVGVNFIQKPLLVRDLMDKMRRQLDH